MQTATGSANSNKMKHMDPPIHQRRPI